MRENVVNFAEIVDRRAEAIERRIWALRNTRARQGEAIRQLQVAYSICTRRLRQLGSVLTGKVSALQLQALSHDGKDCEKQLQALRNSQSLLRAELTRTSTQVKLHYGALVALRKKADYLRDRASVDKRRALRRQKARDCASNQ